MRALDLITSMVNQRNVQAIVRRMSDHLQHSEGAYREHVLSRILQIGAQDNYCYIVDFEWYYNTATHLMRQSTIPPLRLMLTEMTSRCFLCRVVSAGILVCWST